MSDPAPSGHEELVASLSDYLSKQAGQPVEVGGVTRISTGWESDVYAFEAPAWREGGRVLRLYFGKNAARTALHEYHALELLNRGGYPVPQVDLAEPSMQALGRSFLIMQRVEGASLGLRWRSPDPAVRGQAMALFCDLFAGLHTLAWKQLPGAEQVNRVSIAKQLKGWSDFAARNPIHSLDSAMSWLHAAGEKVTPQPLGLVHWDFHHENILMNEADRAWVIDWTQFEATDVRFDLGWTLVLLASERDLATSEEVRAGYAAVRGWDERASRQEMEFFEAAACIKRLVIILMALGQGTESMGLRTGADEIIRGRLARFALLYQRWLALTKTPLSDLEMLLAEHL